MPTYKNPGKLEFDGVIRGTDGGGTFVEFPYDAHELFNAKNLIPVIMSFDGISYRGSLANMGGGLMCLIRKDIRIQLGKDRGDTVHVTIELDDKPRELIIPDELQSAFENNDDIKAFFDGLAFSHRREYVQWISEAKRSETRDARVAKTIEMLTARRKSH